MSHLDSHLHYLSRSEHRWEMEYFSKLYLLSSISDSPQCGAVALGDVLAVIDGLVVVLYHHLFGAVLQVLAFHLIKT